ncbi:MAG: hypothetical protein E6R03_04930 [Hyphomicrobiaceae bacterium]|nr:MAG: hypothetical protein E6R03_04930 [Hyphomicrobiaceae bacterium]
MSENEENVIRVSSMSLAAYLALSGHEPVDTTTEADTVLWVYLESDEVLDLIETFNREEARVEPQSFSRFYGKIKQSFHATRGRGRSSQRASSVA